MILLTGSHGFIGTHFRQQTTFDSMILVDRVVGKNVQDLSSRRLHGIDTIVHLAADISGEESWKDPNAYLFNNTVLTLRLVQNAIDGKVKRFIFASSAAVYGNPMTPYGATKLSAEHFLDCYKDKIDIVMLRFFNVYGKGQNPVYSGVISRFVDSINRKRPITIFGKGDSIRDYVHVNDIVKTLQNAVKGGEEWIGKPIDVGTGKGTSILELSSILENMSGKELKKKFLPEKKEIKKSIANVDKKLLDWEFTSLEDGLKGLFFNK